MTPPPRATTPPHRLLNTAVFGAFDGVVSVLGVVVALLATANHVIVTAAIGLAAAAFVAMGAGEYLGDPDTNLGQALVMAIAAGGGTLLPVLPFVVLAKPYAIVAGLMLTMAVCGAIAAYRARGGSALRAWCETYGVLGAAVGVTIAVTVLTGAAG